MDRLTMVLMLAGSAITFLGALGLYRMPDLYLRMQAAAKASSLGVTFLLLAVAFHFGRLEITTRTAAGILFVLLTSPVAAHLIARAAYRAGVEQWGIRVDELRGANVFQSPRPGDERSD